MGKTVLNYLGQGDKKDFLCPEKLKYNFTPEFPLKVSDKCCYRLKKEPSEKWSRENNKTITITGVRQKEGGLRTSMQGCAVFYDSGCKNLKKFHSFSRFATGKSGENAGSHPLYSGTAESGCKCQYLRIDAGQAEGQPDFPCQKAFCTSQKLRGNSGS